jgi:hypothetical protein
MEQKNLQDNTTIVLRKRIAASKVKDEDGTPIQFLGSGYINRCKNGKACNCSPDAMFVRNLLPDLGYDEGERGEVDVDVKISLSTYDGAVKMWCFGAEKRDRCITPYEPIRHGRNRISVKCSYMQLALWNDKEYFVQIPAGEIFPVYVSVERVKDKKI